MIMLMIIMKKKTNADSTMEIIICIIIILHCLLLLILFNKDPHGRCSFSQLLFVDNMNCSTSDNGHINMFVFIYMFNVYVSCQKCHSQECIVIANISSAGQTRLLRMEARSYILYLTDESLSFRIWKPTSKFLYEEKFE